MNAGHRQLSVSGAAANAGLTLCTSSAVRCLRGPETPRNRPVRRGVHPVRRATARLGSAGGVLLLRQVFRAARPMRHEHATSKTAQVERDEAVTPGGARSEEHTSE